MNNHKVGLHSKELNGGGYKVIEVQMSDSAETTYAVCTPIKKQ